MQNAIRRDLARGLAGGRVKELIARHQLGIGASTTLRLLVCSCYILSDRYLNLFRQVLWSTPNKPSDLLVSFINIPSSHQPVALALNFLGFRSSHCHTHDAADTLLQD